MLRISCISRTKAKPICIYIYIYVLNIIIYDIHQYTYKLYLSSGEDTKSIKKLSIRIRMSKNVLNTRDSPRLLPLHEVGVFGPSSLNLPRLRLSCQDQPQVQLVASHILDGTGSQSLLTQIKKQIVAFQSNLSILSFF